MVGRKGRDSVILPPINLIVDKSTEQKVGSSGLDRPTMERYYEKYKEINEKIKESTASKLGNVANSYSSKVITNNTLYNEYEIQQIMNSVLDKDFSKGKDNADINYFRQVWFDIIKWKNISRRKKSYDTDRCVKYEEFCAVLEYLGAYRRGVN